MDSIFTNDGFYFVCYGMLLLLLLLLVWNVIEIP